jgi:DNA polymerase II large subunit
MDEKIIHQVKVQNMVRAVDSKDAAKRVLEDHFIRDMLGNSRGWGRQVFRCSTCNTKYRRPTLKGKCLKCGGKLILTISKGSVSKYLDISKRVAEMCDLDDYIKDRLRLIDHEIKEIFEAGAAQKKLF